MLFKKSIFTCSLTLLSGLSMTATIAYANDNAPSEESGSEFEADVGDISDASAEEFFNEQFGSQDNSESQVSDVDKAMRAICAIHIGTLTRSGNVLTGRGSQTNCGGTSILRLQRSRWDGWETMQTVRITGPSENYITYNCGGTGTHDFRVIHTATIAATGKNLFKESTHHRWGCGN